MYEAVTAAFDCGGHTFTAKGRRILSEGWREIDRIFRASLKEQPEDEAEPIALPDFTEGQTFDQVDASVTEHFTAPPKAYTEDTLLAAMETAGKEDILRRSCATIWKTLKPIMMKSRYAAARPAAIRKALFKFATGRW